MVIFQVFATPNRRKRVKQLCLTVLPQELYQKLTDYDIRYYMYELLKVML